MTWTLAVAGKGGTGKTTVASLLTRSLMKLNKGPVLTVDADPDANFATGLGIKVNMTVGQVNQEWVESRGSIPTGMSKQQFLLMKLNQTIEERKGLDLITMGRPNGSGCYCSANSVLRDFVDKLKDNYPFMVVDNEAGMEHLSRKTIEKIDALVMVSDPSRVGIRTAGRLIQLAKELRLGIAYLGLIVNRVEDKMPRQIEDAIKEEGVELIGTVPQDKEVGDFSLDERSLIELPDGNPAAASVVEILEKLRAKTA